MSIFTVNASPTQDEKFLQSFELAMLGMGDNLELIDPPLPETTTFDKIPDVMVLDKHPISITNPSKTWKADAAQYFFPLNLGAVVTLVKSAHAENKKIRVIGQRHSFSEACLTDDFFLDLSKAHPYDPKKHNQTVGEIDQSALSLLKESEEVEKYFDVPGGMQIFMINKILCPEDDQLTARFGQRRLYNMGGGDVQSFAGAFSTGTHGSGGQHSAYHDMVRSILLVAGEGMIYRIEPSNGITDKIKHDQFYAENPNLTTVVLIQDDDKFYAALVSFGCFGIIYSAIIETIPMCFLSKEIKYHPGKWNGDTVKATIENFINSLNETREIFHSVQFNPYAIGKKKHPSYLTRTFKPIDGQVIVGKDENVQKWPAAFTKLPWVGDVIQFLANHRLSPPRRLIEAVLKTQEKDDGRQDFAYRIWNAGTSGRLMSIGTGIEFAFPVTNVYRIINLLIAHLNQVGVKQLGYYVNGPIAVRFVRASKAFLAPNQAKLENAQHDWWCYIEIVRVNSSDPEDDKKELEIYKHLQMMLMLKGGRPHWGLNFQFPFTLDYLRCIYPDIDKWLAAKAFFDPNKTFESKVMQSWLS